MKGKESISALVPGSVTSNWKRHFQSFWLAVPKETCGVHPARAGRRQAGPLAELAQRGGGGRVRQSLLDDLGGVGAVVPTEMQLTISHSEVEPGLLLVAVSVVTVAVGQDDPLQAWWDRTAGSDVLEVPTGQDGAAWELEL